MNDYGAQLLASPSMAHAFLVQLALVQHRLVPTQYLACGQNAHWYLSAQFTPWYPRGQ